MSIFNKSIKQCNSNLFKHRYSEFQQNTFLTQNNTSNIILSVVCIINSQFRTVQSRIIEKHHPVKSTTRISSLCSTRVFGHGLGSFTYSVFCQFSGKQQAHRRLNLSATDCRTLVVGRQSRGLGSNPLEHVIDKTVHD